MNAFSQVAIVPMLIGDIRDLVRLKMDAGAHKRGVREVAEYLARAGVHGVVLKQMNPGDK